jgi:hypothetical protein
VFLPLPIGIFALAARVLCQLGCTELAILCMAYPLGSIKTITISCVFLYAIMEIAEPPFLSLKTKKKTPLSVLPSPNDGLYDLGSWIMHNVVHYDAIFEV